MVDALAHWIEGTTLSWAIAHGYPWLWPALEILHFLGMAVLIGTVGLLDLRMLGLFKSLPFGPLERLVPWAVMAFAINLVTGALFVIGQPWLYVDSFAFLMKLLFIAIAGANALLFYFTGLAGRVDRLGPGEDAPLTAKLVGATSLCLWFGVIYWGRMLPYVF